MAEVQKEIIGRMSKDDMEEWRFELRFVNLNFMQINHNIA